ncbi:hypothetical protein C1H46_018381 [Malus baccata]|uniref:LSM-interacting domain-containing protein n=1 Tax=Malus baccata TaxID=106549 RepID=A0A540MC33_MALBA|nr:hypothetical protein C1H46_018381 [Malus baccata]
MSTKPTHSHSSPLNNICSSGGGATTGRARLEAEAEEEEGVESTIQLCIIELGEPSLIILLRPPMHLWHVKAQQSTYNQASDNVQLRGKNTFATPRNILALGHSRNKPKTEEQDDEKPKSIDEFRNMFRKD